MKSSRLEKDKDIKDDIIKKCKKSFKIEKTKIINK